MTNRYMGFAAVYDRAGAVAFNQAAIEKVRATAANSGLAPGRCLDLACGTGNLAVALAREGWQVIGLDHSPAMLALARAKAEAAGVAVRWLEADMRGFTLEEPADLVTCFYDALNHLPARADLARTFRSVAAALRPGGLFLFDVSTEACFRNLWQDCLHLSETADHLFFAENTFDAKTGRGICRITGFTRRPDGLYERFEDTIEERCFTDEEIRAAARRSGLEVVGTEGWTPAVALEGVRNFRRLPATPEFNPDSRDQNLKTYWVLRRAGPPGSSGPACRRGSP